MFTVFLLCGVLCSDENLDASLVLPSSRDNVVVRKGESLFFDCSEVYNFDLHVWEKNRLYVVATNQAGFGVLIWPNSDTDDYSQTPQLRLTAEDIFGGGVVASDSLVLHLLRLDTTEASELKSVLAGCVVQIARRPGQLDWFSALDRRLFDRWPHHTMVVFERPDFRKLGRHLAYDARAQQLLEQARVGRERMDPSAIRSAEAALAVAKFAYPESLFPRGHERVSVMLLRLGVLLIEYGEYGRAEKVLAEALENAQSAFKFRNRQYEHSILAACHFALAQLYDSQGRYKKVITSAKLARDEATKIRSRALQPVSYEYKAIGLALEARAFLLLGEAKEAALLWRRAVRAGEKRGDSSSSDRDRVRFEIRQMWARTLKEIGRFELAIDFCNEVFEIYEEAGRPQMLRSDVIVTYGLAGWCQLEQGLYAAALDSVRAGMELADDLDVSDLDGPIADLHWVLVGCCLALDDFSQLLRHARRIQSQLNSYEPKNNAQCVTHTYSSVALATAFRETGEFDRALQILEDCVEKIKMSSVEVEEQVSFTLFVELAHVCALAGDLSSAENYLGHARAASAANNHVFRCFLLDASLAYQRNEKEVLQSIYPRFEDFDERDLKNSDRILAHRVAEGVARSLGKHKEAAGHARRALELLLGELTQLASETNLREFRNKRREARSLLDVMLADGLRAELPSELMRAAVQRYYASDFVFIPPAAAKNSQLTRRTRELESLWRATLLASARSARDAQRQATEIERALEEIGRLERGTLLIRDDQAKQLSVPGDSTPPVVERTDRWLLHRLQAPDAQHLLLFWTHGTESGVLVLNAEQFDRKLANWRRNVRAGVDAEEELLWMSRQFRNVLAGVGRRLTIEGDGLIFHVPWAALLVDGQPLVTRTSVLLAFGSPGKGEPVQIDRQAAIVLVGDVHFGNDWGIERLPHSKQETQRVSEHFGNRRIALQRNATRDWTLKHLADAEIAHLATHGIGWSTVRLLGRQSAPLLAERPFLGAGLLLAATEEDKPQLLTADSIAQMKLPQLKLVVLSACDSAVTAGEDPSYSLPRAFHLAGARRVLSTQWPVDDSATSVLMQLFYDNLVDGRLEPAEALRRAQLTLLRHPEKIPDLAKLRGPDFTKAAKKLNKELGGSRVDKKKTDSSLDPRLWAGFVVSTAG